MKVPVTALLKEKEILPITLLRAVKENHTYSSTPSKSAGADGASALAQGHFDSSCLERQSIGHSVAPAGPARGYI